MLYKTQLKLLNKRTYLIIEVFEGKSELFSSWHTSDTEVKPSFIEFTVFEMRFAVRADPQINAILVLAPTCLSQVTRAEIRPDHNLTVNDMINGPLRKVIHVILLYTLAHLGATGCS